MVKEIIMTSREIAIELLKKWVDDEVSLMWEFSTDFDGTRQDIWKKTQVYLDKLEVDDLDYIDELKEKIFH